MAFFCSFTVCISYYEQRSLSSCQFLYLYSILFYLSMLCNYTDRLLHVINTINSPNFLHLLFITHMSD